MLVQSLDRSKLLVAPVAGQLVVDDLVDGGLALLPAAGRPQMLHQAVLVGERVLALGTEEPVAGRHKWSGAVGTRGRGRGR